MSGISVSKIEGLELPVPLEWRPAFKCLVDGILEASPTQYFDGFILERMHAEKLRISLENILAYPEPISRLSERSWETSIYVWSRSYWDVLVDLTTLSNQISDLVLHATVFERGGKFLIQPDLVYVP